MHHQIDSLAYTNRLRSLPPEHRLGFALALFLLSYLVPPHLQLAVTLWLAVWIVGYAGIPAGIYLKLLVVPMSFYLMSLPALVLNASFTLPAVGADAAWGMSVGPAYLYLSQQGLAQARDLLARSLALTSCLDFILLTVPFVEIVRVLERLGCPPLLVELLSLMYRFIFILTETAAELLAAQQSRCGYGNWRSSIRSLSLAAGQLLWRTLENYRQISLGLTSRGFDGKLRVWHSRRYQSNWRYASEAIGGCALLSILAGLHHADGI